MSEFVSRFQPSLPFREELPEEILIMIYRFNFEPEKLCQFLDYRLVSKRTQRAIDTILSSKIKSFKLEGQDLGSNEFQEISIWELERKLKLLPGVHTLDLTRFYITDIALRKFNDICPTIKSIRFETCPNVTQSLEKVNLSSLQIVKLISSSFSDKSLINFLKSSHLTELVVTSGRQYSTGAFLKYLPDTIKTLKIDLTHLPFPDYTIGSLSAGNGINLTYLSIHVGIIEMGVLFSIAKLENLQTLNLAFIARAGVALLALLSDMRKLQNLALYEYLDVDYDLDSTSDDIPESFITDRCLMTLSKRFYGQLRSLKLYSLSNTQMRFGEVFLNYLYKSAKQLEELVIYFSLDSGDQEFRDISRLPLRKLEIAGLQITNRGLKEYLNSQTNLRELSIGYCQRLSDKIYKYVTKYAKTIPDNKFVLNIDQSYIGYEFASNVIVTYQIFNDDIDFK